MADFVSTTNGKIVNIDAIAFLTSRQPAGTAEGASGKQLIIGFSAAASTAQVGMIPLSLVLEGDEAIHFLDQLEGRGVEVLELKRKLVS